MRVRGGLVGIVGTGALVALACSAAAPPGEEAPDPYGTARIAGDSRATERLACAFDAGAMPSETLGADVELVGAPGGLGPALAKIEHVVVVMLENRSFDHLLGDLSTLPEADRVPSRVRSKGKDVERYHERAFCPPDAEQPRHEWGDAHLQLAEGRMDGFVTASDCRALGFYDRDDLPVLHRLAESGATSSRYFSSLLGPTWPNRLFLLTGTSCGFAEGFDSNPRVTTECGAVKPSWLTHLDGVEVFDESGLTSVIVALLVLKDRPKSFGEFVQRAASGDLPKIAFVGASTGSPIPIVNPVPEEDDGHPPSDIRRTELFLHDVVSAVTNGPAWGSTALFITFDEHGGYYDHVKPPRACPPDGPLPDGQRRDHEFDQLGFRVPLVLVSPFARPGYVSRIDADHTSILRFLELWQKKPALTKRDANAWPLVDLFDFAGGHPKPALPPRPTVAPCDPNMKPTCPN